MFVWRGHVHARYRRWTMKAFYVSVLSVLAAVSIPAQQPTLSEAKFDELRALLTPDPQTMWRRIPWRVELLEAQREAAAQNKPLFIWAMDGHPLGCT